MRSNMTAQLTRVFDQPGVKMVCLNDDIDGGCEEEGGRLLGVWLRGTPEICVCVVGGGGCATEHCRLLLLLLPPDGMHVW